MTFDRNQPIAVFDSGVGGLTVARRIARVLPGERIVYFGDTARTPYGIHTKERITAQSMQIMRFLSTHSPKMAVIACNTICVSSYDELAASFAMPIIEIVSPAAADCVSGNPARVGVIATEATCRSGSYRTEIQNLDPSVEVYQTPCPDLVTLAERGLADTPAAARTCEAYLKELKEKDIDSLILGCTHFPLFAEHIAAYLGESVRLVDPAIAATEWVKRMLASADLEARRGAPPEHEFYISGDTEVFGRVAANFLGAPVRAEKIDIEKY